MSNNNDIKAVNYTDMIYVKEYIDNKMNECDEKFYKTTDVVTNSEYAENATKSSKSESLMSSNGSEYIVRWNGMAQGGYEIPLVSKVYHSESDYVRYDADQGGSKISLNTTDSTKRLENLYFNDGDIVKIYFKPCAGVEGGARLKIPYQTAEFKIKMTKEYYNNNEEQITKNDCTQILRHNYFDHVTLSSVFTEIKILIQQQNINDDTASTFHAPDDRRILQVKEVKKTIARFELFDFEKQDSTVVVTSKEYDQADVYISRIYSFKG